MRAQHASENLISKPILFAYWYPSSLGYAIPFTPALIAKTSVFDLCSPNGLAQPSKIGVLAIKSLEANVTLAISSGDGGVRFSIGVRSRGLSATIITAAELILR